MDNTYMMYSNFKSLLEMTKYHTSYKNSVFDIKWLTMFFKTTWLRNVLEF